MHLILLGAAIERYVTVLPCLERSSPKPYTHQIFARKVLHMNVPLGEDAQPPHSDNVPDLLKLSIQAAQSTFTTLHYSGRLLSERTTIEDCQLQLLARDDAGNQVPEWNLDIEFYTVSTQLSLMIERQEKTEYPILWQGQNSVWMDAETGVKVDRPSDGEPLEWLARKLMKKLGGLTP